MLASNEENQRRVAREETVKMDEVCIYISKTKLLDTNSFFYSSSCCAEYQACGGFEKRQDRNCLNFLVLLL